MTSRTDLGVRLSWIIVAHQSSSDLAQFLPSLRPVLEGWRREGVFCELIIVDNASTDDSVAVARRLAPDALLIESTENVGYGPAINTAVRRASGEWLIIGNADLVVPAGGLDGLPDVLTALPDDVALAGPTLLDREGHPTLSAGFFPTLATLVRGLVRKCRDRKYLPRRRHVAGPVDWVTGACLFARRAPLVRAGGFDQEFFLYYEDVDLAQRLSRAGQRCMYAPSMRVVHLSPHHVRPPQAQIEIIVRSSRKAYFAKHRPAWEQFFLSLLGKLEPIIRRSGPESDKATGEGAMVPQGSIGQASVGEGVPAAVEPVAVESDGGRVDVAEPDQGTADQRSPVKVNGKSRSVEGDSVLRERELALAEALGGPNGHDSTDR